MNDNVKIAMENQIFREKLFKAGIYPMMGPVGPKGEKGDGINILGSYGSYEELILHHPVGEAGDCYLISGCLYVWDVDSGSWVTCGNIQGPPGVSEKISIGNVTTGQSYEEAEVIDNFDGEVHTLDFVIPKGDTGDKGDQGEKGDIGPTGPQGIKGDIGPTGPRGTLGPTSYDVIAFASYKDSTTAGSSDMTSMRLIPGVSDYISFSNYKTINILRTGVFEINFCGRISGVTSNTGGKFYLYNVTTSEKISDMEFVLDRGTTADMDFSEINVTDIYGPAELEVRTEITGDASSNIKFSMINIVIKGYKM